ncbi:hypothetical protein ACFY7X_13630 [Streptomyces althioticus]|uniref:hypothetical protein n=1 Tax=Streptomyces althioticus TaxID=83380 RepID=UPI0034093321
MTDQKAAEGPQERPEGGLAGLAPPEPLTGAQTGADGLAHSCTNCEGVDPDTCLINPGRHLHLHNAGPTVAECAEADRRWWNGEKAGE